MTVSKLVMIINDEFTYSSHFWSSLLYTTSCFLWRLIGLLAIMILCDKFPNPVRFYWMGKNLCVAALLGWEFKWRSRRVDPHCTLHVTHTAWNKYAGCFEDVKLKMKSNQVQHLFLRLFIFSKNHKFIAGKFVQFDLFLFFVPLSRRPKPT